MEEKESKTVRVAAVVVTYNRKYFLRTCLDALLNQTYPLDAIYIIDNACTDGTPELLRTKGLVDQLPVPSTKPLEVVTTTSVPRFPVTTCEIHYVRMHENTGGAGGFHEGISRSFEAGYEALWLMDDDVEPSDNCLANLVHSPLYDHNSLLMPVRFYKDNTFVKSESRHLNYTNVLKGHKVGFVTPRDVKEPLSIECFPFEGVLMKRDVVEKIGYPNKDFFVIADDTDYSIRALRAHFKIFMLSNAILYRQIKPPRISKIDWKSYYYIRNLIALDRMYGNRLVSTIRPFAYLGRLMVGCIARNRSKHEFRIVLDAFLDGFRLHFRRVDTTYNIPTKKGT